MNVTIITNTNTFVHIDCRIVGAEQTNKFGGYSRKGICGFAIMTKDYYKAYHWHNIKSITIEEKVINV